MQLEKKILTFSWITCAVCLVLFIPRKRLREAQVIFLFKQALTMLIGVAVVQKRLISYPYRFFNKAINSSFTFEYFIFPSISVFFNLYYPQYKSKGIQCLYYLIYASLMTTLEVFLERNTQLIKYLKWKWWYSWTSIMASFYLSRKYYLWFYKIKN